jgi:hypothetical protein
VYNHSEWGAKSRKSYKQTVIRSCIMCAELVASYETSRQVKWLKKFIPGLKVEGNVKTPLEKYCDDEPIVVMLTTTSQVGLPSTLTESFVL